MLLLFFSPSLKAEICEGIFVFIQIGRRQVASDYHSRFNCRGFFFVLKKKEEKSAGGEFRDCCTP